MLKMLGRDKVCSSERIRNKASNDQPPTFGVDDSAAAEVSARLRRSCLTLC